MGLRIITVTLGACIMLTGCAGSKIARDPVWVSSSINGLQQSQCNCGGVETKKAFKKRRDAEAKAQERQAHSYEGGND